MLQSVKASGGTTGLVSAAVLGTDLGVKIDGQTVTGLIITTNCSAGGDSGGPLVTTTGTRQT